MKVPKEGVTEGTGSAGGEGSSRLRLDSTFRLSRFSVTDQNATFVSNFQVCFISSDESSQTQTDTEA